MNSFAMKRIWGPTPKYDRVLSYEHPHNNFTIIAGPCSVESREQIHKIADYVSSSGATHLRGGVFRCGTFPGENFGWVNADLISEYFSAAQKHNLKNIIEVLDYRDINFVGQYCTDFQIGCRQQQNYTLLSEVGRSGKPVFLKRHPASTIDEFLGSAEYILKSGCKELYLIERGSVGNARHVRWDLSISMIPAIKSICKIPILVDASHGTGRRDLVVPMTLAGVAAGADGVLIETHYDPQNSLSDAEQCIGPLEFNILMNKIKEIRSVL